MPFIVLLCKIGQMSRNWWLESVTVAIIKLKKEQTYLELETCSLYYDTYFKIREV